MKQSLHSFHRGLALLLVVMLLASLMLPAAASAEGILSGADTGQELPLETGGAGDTDEAGPAGAEASQGNSSPADEPVIQDPPGQNAGIPEAGSSPAGQSAAPARDNSSPPEESNSSAQGEGAISSAVSSGSASADGTISSAGGSSSSGSSGSSGTVEYFVASYGSDSYDGSPEAPFATLSHACAVAAGTGADSVVLLLLTDLECDETLSFYGKSFVLTSENDPCTIIRAEDFRSEDGDEDPLIIVGDSEQYGDNGEDTELVLEYITLDDSEGNEVGGATIEVCDGARLVVGEDASVLSRGSMVAVHGDSEAEIHVYDSGTIRGGTPILEEEGCLVTIEDGADVPGYEPRDDGDSEEDEESDEDETADEGSESFGSDSGQSGTLLSANTGNDSLEESSFTNGGEESDPIDEDGDDSDGNTDSDSGSADNPDSGRDVSAQQMNGDNPGDQQDSEAISEASQFSNAMLNEPTVSVAQAQNNTLLSSADKPLLAAPPLRADQPQSPFGIDFYLLADPEIISTSDPETPGGLTTYYGNNTGYVINYTLNLSLSGILGGFASAAVTGAYVKLDIELANGLFPETKAYGSTDVAVSVSPDGVLSIDTASYSGNRVTLALNLIESASLPEELTLAFKTILPSARLNTLVDTTLVTTASVDSDASSVTYDLIGNTGTITLTAADVSAETKILGERSATLVYDPNGGTGGPGTQTELPAESEHELDTEPVPTHEDADGSPVLFIGWTEDQTTNIYSSGDNPPQIITSVSLSANTTTTVYAAWSYDRNDDSIPDINQRLITLHYDPTYGSGAPEDQIKILRGQEETFNIAETEPVLEHYQFVGWKTESSANAQYRYNKVGELQDEIRISQDTTLYAVWEPSEYSLNYYVGEGNGAPVEQWAPIQEDKSATFIVSTEEPIRSGYSFQGWSYSEGSTIAEVQPGDTITVQSDTELYAVWQKIYVLSYNANGGSGAPGPQTSEDNRIVISSQEPIRHYYVFQGWAESSTATEASYSAGEVYQLDEDTVLYAVWKSAPVYTLYFNGTGAADAPSPQSATADYDPESGKYVASLTITKKIPTRNRYSFVGWSPSRYGSASFSPGEDVKLTGGDVTLYAIWRRDTGTSSTSTDGKAPRTGDESNTALYAALALGSAAALGAGVYVLKKKRS